MKLSGTQMAFSWVHHQRIPSSVKELSSLLCYPLCGNVLYLINLFAHMPEKCNFLFDTENWPLTDFHYMYISSPWPGMRQLDLSNDKGIDGTLRGREEVHPIGQSFSFASICAAGIPSHSWQPQKCSTKILSHNSALRKRTRKRQWKIFQQWKRWEYPITVRTLPLAK